MLSTWRHSGFHVFCGNRIQPKEEPFSYDLPAKKVKIIASLAEQGLLEIRDGFLKPTCAGMAVADSLALI